MPTRFSIFPPLALLFWYYKSLDFTLSRHHENSPLLRNIGKAVARRRLELGLSQEELGQRAAIHRTYVSDVERGVRNVSVLTLDRIAKSLDMPLAALLIAVG